LLSQQIYMRRSAGQGSRLYAFKLLPTPNSTRRDSKWSRTQRRQCRPSIALPLNPPLAICPICPSQCPVYRPSVPKIACSLFHQIINVYFMGNTCADKIINALTCN
jgi:hypothetical protein